MLKNIVPLDIYEALNKVNISHLNEIRIRSNKPIVVSIGGQRFFLGYQGVTSNLKEAIIASKTMVEDIIFRASECSIYSVNEQIKKGFIVTDKGLRIGIGGDYIEENGVARTMSNYSSVNIRIPHEIKNCCLKAFDLLLDNQQVQNTLILSPPGAGKTTFLRDFIYQLSERNYAYNVLILDERGEIDIGSQCGIGNFADKICFARKKVGFENGIRSLSPNIIVTDELGQTEDINAVLYAVNCGVSIIASAHCESIDQFLNKESFEKIIHDKVFKRYVVLSMRHGPGTIEGVYNENFSRVKY